MMINVPRPHFHQRKPAVAHHKFPVETAGYIVCPACMEILTQQDLEGFGRCPYCDHAFEMNTEMEDFLLAPVIRMWKNQARDLEADTFQL